MRRRPGKCGRQRCSLLHPKVDERNEALTFAPTQHLGTDTMQPSRLGFSTLLFLASLLFAGGDSLGGTDETSLTPITKPLRSPPRTQTAAPRVARTEAPPTLPEKRAVPMPVDVAASDGSCEDSAPCQPYYRNRPKGCHPDQIKLANRMGEPNWYRYYRCVHFGYHPTQWHAWPDGWLTCRHPQPGKHPYDIERPKPDPRVLDRERRLQRERAEPSLLDEPLPGLPGDELRQLPPPQNTTPPPITPGQTGPSSVPNVPTPIVR